MAGRAGRALAALLAAALAWHPAAAGAAHTTYDIHFRLYCHPPAPGPNPALCGNAAWNSVADIREAYQTRVMPVLNRIYEPTGVSFRLFDLTYDTSRPDFAGVTTRGSLDPPDDDARAIHEMRQIARQPGNKDRIQVFALPRIPPFSGVPPAFTCSGGDNDLLECKPQQSDPCPGGGSCEPTPDYGVFVGTGLPGDPILLGHEMGHHFCLGHTHRGVDSAQSGAACNPPVSHDGDGLSDTGADPAPLGRVSQGDWDAATADQKTVFEKERDAIVPDALKGDRHPDYQQLDFFGCHQWCDWSRTTVGFHSPINAALGEPKRVQLCTPICYSSGTDPGATWQADLGHAPDTPLVLSYYFRECSGPWVVGGSVVPAFSQLQVKRVANCIQDVPARQDYVDVCETEGGDTDGDGICDQDDVCKNVFNPDLLDGDNDGIPDACDLAPFLTSDVVLDVDFDLFGDPVDPDIDNDGCLNADDQHPEEALFPVATETRPGCEPEEVTIYSFEGADFDNDGLPSCADDDDDGDGILDEDDPCPIFSGATGCNRLTQICPALWATLCEGSSCLPFDLTLISLVNPAEEIRFDFQIAAGRLFLAPLPGRTTAETLFALGGGFFTAEDGAPPPMRLEIRSRESGEVAAVVLEELRADALDHDRDAAGRLLALAVDERGRLAVTRSWAVGAPPGLAFPDGDGDGVPDLADNCLAHPNPLQADTDRDGFGDRCDLDLDQDLEVSEAERQLVLDCDGVDFENAVSMPLADEELPGLTDRELELLGLQGRCGPADLSADGKVDAEDALLAAGLVGLPPGPSGVSVGLPAEDEPEEPEVSFLAVVGILLLVLVAILLFVGQRRRRRA